MTRTAGFGLIDSLVALLLLALAVLAVLLALLQSIRGTHDAALQTRAVDLVADVAEDVQSARSPVEVAGVVRDWQERVPASLPIAVDSRRGTVSAAPLLLPSAPAVQAMTVQLEWRTPGAVSPFSVALAVPGSPPLVTP
jgi:type II secretory pathway pseudopilin PulG